MRDSTTATSVSDIGIATTANQEERSTNALRKVNSYYGNDDRSRKASQQALNTKLLEAAQEGQAPRVKRLLELGADVDYYPSGDSGSTVEGHIALQLAAARGHTPVVKVLIAGGADTNERDKRRTYGGTTALYKACSGHVATMEALLGAGANVHQKLHGGSTYLHHAFRGALLVRCDGGAKFVGHDVVTVLIKAGADWHAGDDRGPTPLDLIKHINDDDHKQIIEKYGFNSLARPLKENVIMKLMDGL